MANIPIKDFTEITELHNGDMTVIGDGSQTNSKFNLGKALGELIKRTETYTKAQIDSLISNHHDSTKQDTIDDLDDIREGAELGATAVQPTEISDMATQTWVNGKGYQNSTQVENAITSKLNDYYDKDETNDLLDEKANTNGFYGDLSVGQAENLIGKGATTPSEFVYRTTTGSQSIAEGEADATLDKIKGKTLVFNQLCYGDFSDLSKLIFSPNTVTVSNKVASLLALKKYDLIIQDISVIANHKYLQYGMAKTTQPDLVFFGVDGAGINNSNIRLTTGITDWQTYSHIWSPTKNGILEVRLIMDARPSDYDAIQIKNCMLIDLTQMFGEGNEPTTVEEFKSLFPLDYYDYNEGTLLNFNGTGIKTNGFNQWDEEWEVGYYTDSAVPVAHSNSIRSKNDMPCLPNTNYCLLNNSTKQHQHTIIFLDNNKNPIIAYTIILGTRLVSSPPNARYFKISLYDYGTTYNHDICINLSWSGYRNGEYEPYWERTLSLPISQYFPDGMKSAGGVYDELTKDKAIKKIKEVVLDGSEDWSLFYSDGINQLYLSSPPKNKKIKFIPNVVTINSAKYIGINIDNRYYNYNTCYIAYDDLICFNLEGYTVKTWKQYLQSNPITVIGLCLDDEIVETPINPPLNLTYKVDDFGTEMLLPQNDSEPTTTPINADIRYNLDYEAEVRNLPKNYQSQTSMDNLLTALGTALGFTWTKAFVDGKYTYQITKNEVQE